MCDVKGRHDLITWGWTKFGAHARSNTSIFRTTRVFFLDKYDFSVLPSSLRSVIYCCPHRTSQFLELVSTTQSTASLTFNTQQITTFLAIQPVRCHVCHTENLPHQSTLHCYSQWFHAIIAMGVLALSMSFNLCGRNCVCTHVQLSCVYFASTLHVTHVIKCTRLFPTLAERTWERSYMLLW